MKLGSLFDGSGGFPLGARNAGIEPIWASEIEPFPIRVTRKNFPGMQHLGDVANIHGDEIEPVDILTFGSPCQDLSIAGARAGLEGNRSGLFFEAIRIIKEMKEKTDGEYPKYAVWENVTAALTSQQGRDFREVLAQFCKVTDSEVSIPEPEDKWTRAGVILGDGYSVAWRVLDAQYWGVPQHRERIYLVADFTGHGAGEILFESEGMRGHSQQSQEKSQGTASDSGRCTERSNSIWQPIENHPNDSRVRLMKEDKVQTLTSRMGTGGGNVPLVMRMLAFGHYCEDDISSTLKARDYKDATDLVVKEKTIRRLTPLECCRLQGFPDNWCQGLEITEPTDEDMNFWTDVWSYWNRMNGKKLKSENQIRKWLQAPHTDSAEYKLWGNGVALPCVQFVIDGIKWWEDNKL